MIGNSNVHSSSRVRYSYISFNVCQSLSSNHLAPCIAKHANKGGVYINSRPKEVSELLTCVLSLSVLLYIDHYENVIAPTLNTHYVFIEYFLKVFYSCGYQKNIISILFLIIFFMISWFIIDCD